MCANISVPISMLTHIFLKLHFNFVWVSSNFDSLWLNPHPQFIKNIQYFQGFAVIHPMNMRFYASIYAFRWPKVSRKFHMTLSCIVLYRYFGKSVNCQTILHYRVHCILLPRGSIVGQNLRRVIIKKDSYIDMFCFEVQ